MYMQSALAQDPRKEGLKVLKHKSFNLILFVSTYYCKTFTTGTFLIEGYL